MSKVNWKKLNIPLLLFILLFFGRQAVRVIKDRQIELVWAVFETNGRPFYGGKLLDYSVEYPQTWRAASSLETSRPRSFPLRSAVFSRPAIFSGFSRVEILWEQKTEEDDSLWSVRDWYENQVPDEEIHCLAVESIDTMTVGTRCRIPPYGDLDLYLLHHENVYLALRLYKTEANSDELDQIFSHMLETFRIDSD